jgi:glucose-6-phosphate 1-epimerase
MMVDGCAVARYALTSDEAADPHWPHRFALTYEVRLGGQQLDLSLEVHNPSDESWEFCAALHTYLRIDPRHDACLSGLQGVAYHDHVSGEPACRQTDAILVIASEVDRMYVDTPALLQLDDGLRIIEIRQKGFLDTVVWNPGADKGALLTDLEAGADRAFVCVEAAAIARPVVLAAGQRWHGTQTLQVVACAD